MSDLGLAAPVPMYHQALLITDHRFGSVVDIAALVGCLSSPACIVTQATGGLIIGMLLFLVAAGLTHIFGVLKVINFTHGSSYMLGAYFQVTLFQLTDSYTLTTLGPGLATDGV